MSDHPGIFVGGQGRVAAPGVSPLRRFVDEATANGWSLEGNLVHGSVTLVHEDGTKLSSYWYRGGLCGGHITTSAGTKEEISADEVRAAIRGARCSCSDPTDVFGYPHVTPPENPKDCAFNHAQVRVDLKAIADTARFAKEWDEYVARMAAKARVS